MSARITTLHVTFHASLKPLINAFRKLSEGVAEVNESVLGIPNPYRVRRETCAYQRKQRQLRDHVLRINAGSRRRQMRSRRLFT